MRSGGCCLSICGWRFSGTFDAPATGVPSRMLKLYAIQTPATILWRSCEVMARVGTLVLFSCAMNQAGQAFWVLVPPFPYLTTTQKIVFAKESLKRTRKDGVLP